MIGKASVRKVIKNKRQLLTVVSAVFIISALMLTGIFSYFHSEDVVTNKLTGMNGSVLLREPEWDSRGQKMAAASEPGMNIPKDPYALNDGETDLYIRLKMTVRLADFDGTGKTDAYKEDFRYTAAQRLKPIVEAIKLNASETDDTAFVTLDPTGNVSAWTVTTGNTLYYTDGANHGDNESLVYYFYYTAGSTDSEGAPLMAAVKPGDATAKLFRRIELPIYKKDYLGVFDQGYDIDILAEGIPAADMPVLKAAEAAEKITEE